MAYQNVGTPRFYINIPEWLSSHGVMPLTVSGNKRVLRTLPINLYSAAEDIDLMIPIYPYYMPGMTDNGFIAALGHNFATRDVFYHLYTNLSDPIGVTSMVAVANAYIEDGGQTVHAAYDGFSISTFNTNNREIWIIWMRDDFGGGTVGSMVIGTYYDMPHGPDLKLEMSREMDGVKRNRTKGGSDLVNYRYTKPPISTWSGQEHAAWELETNVWKHWLTEARVGRRTWDLSFSHLDNGDVFGPNQSVGIPMDAVATAYHPMYTGFGLTGGADPFEGYDTSDLYMPSETENNSEGFNDNLLTDDNFFSQVIHKTNGGQLPFIFQPNKDDNSPDNFAICKFDMNSFEFDQVANGVYNIKLKIREVW